MNRLLIFMVAALVPLDRLPAIRCADEIIILAAGGNGAHSACIAPWAAGRLSRAVTKQISWADKDGVDHSFVLTEF